LDCRGVAVCVRFQRDPGEHLLIAQDVHGCFLPQFGRAQEHAGQDKAVQVMMIGGAVSRPNIRESPKCSTWNTQTCWSERCGVPRNGVRGRFRRKRLDPGRPRGKDVPDDRQLFGFCVERSGGRRAGGDSFFWFQPRPELAARGRARLSEAEQHWPGDGSAAAPTPATGPRPRTPTRGVSTRWK